MPESGEPTRKELYLSLSRRAKEPFYMQANYYIFLPQDYIEWRSHYGIYRTGGAFDELCLSLSRRAKEPFYVQANYYIFLPQDYIEWRSHYGIYRTGGAFDVLTCHAPMPFKAL